MARIEMISDTIADVEEGHHRAKPDGPETQWAQHIDIVWLDRQLYNRDNGATMTNGDTTTNGNASRISEVRDMLKFDGPGPGTTFADILGELESTSWIMKSAPFPPVPSFQEPRECMIFSLKRRGNYRSGFERDFLGIFITKGALKRRQADSPSPTPTESNSEAGARIE